MRYILDISVDEIEKVNIPDKHYEYVVRVNWSDGNVNVVSRRYSRFFSLQSRILDKFPQHAGIYSPAQRTIPFLPGKIFFGRSQVKRIAVDRIKKINSYCKALVRLPEAISNCEEILNFFESDENDLKSIKRRSSPIAVAGDSISDPIALEQYLAIADYEKDGRNETSLKAGNIVEVVEKNESGWWFVNTASGQGWVPSSYLEKTDGDDNRILPSALSERGNKFICTHDYDAEDADEISLRKGGYVHVLEKNLDGWWLVWARKQEGRAPSTYLAPIDSVKGKRLLRYSHKGAVEIIPTAHHASNISPVRHKANAKITANERLNQTTENNHHSQAKELQPANPRLFKTQLQQKLESNLFQQSRVNGDYSGQSYSERDNVDVAGDTDDIYWNEIEPPEICSTDEAPFETKIPPRRKTLERSGAKLTLSSNYQARSEDRTESYMAIESYQNTAGDGIDLVEGETLAVLERTDTGWWLVVGIHGEGWAPSPFIQQVPRQPIVNNAKQAPVRPPPPKFQKPKPEILYENIANTRCQGHVPNPQGCVTSRPDVTVIVKSQSNGFMPHEANGNLKTNLKSAHCEVDQANMLVNRTVNDTDNGNVMRKPKIPAAKPKLRGFKPKLVADQPQASSSQDHLGNVKSPASKVSHVNRLKHMFEQNG